MLIDLKYYQANYSKLLPADKSLAILDFGCGPGHTLNYLKSVGYYNLSGADICTADSWNDLRSKGIKLEAFTDTETYLLSIPQHYDLIVVKDVIYYFSEHEVVGIVKLLKKALKPGGHIIFEIINGSVVTGAFARYKDIDIQTVLTEHTIQTIITRAGLQTEYIKGNVISVTGVRSFAYFLINNIHRFILRLLYFAERGYDEQNPKILSKKIIAFASVC